MTPNLIRAASAQGCRRHVFLSLLTLVAMLSWSSPSRAQWTQVGNLLHPSNLASNLGVGSANPLARLEVQSGANPDGSGGTHVALAYASGGFRHWIQTRHFAGRGNGNAIDFYVNSSSSLGGSNRPGVGNLHVMTLDNGKVGIGTRAPIARLNVHSPAPSPGQPPVGTAVFSTAQGPRTSQIHAGTTGDWFIRSASDDGKVILQDFGGNVGIGTANPQAKLSVNGKIASREVEVTLDGWPDFVFDEDYDLPPLEGVAEYVARHKHLPDLPSEAEVRVNGLNLGAMQAKLVQKVEELTLYSIKLQRENQRLREELEQRTRKIEERLARLEAAQPGLVDDASSVK